MKTLITTLPFVATIALLATGAFAQKITYHSNGGGTSATYGNTTYHSKGGTSATYGNTTYHSKGGTSATYGNTTYHSQAAGGGTSANYGGNITYHSKGGTSATYGSSTAPSLNPTPTQQVAVDTPARSSAAPTQQAVVSVRRIKDTGSYEDRVARESREREGKPASKYGASTAETFCRDGTIAESLFAQKMAERRGIK